MNTTPSTRRLLMPLISGGILMAAYLLLRPYGDQRGAGQAAEAIASTWWVVAHACGMLALAQYARAALRLSEFTPGSASLLARWSGLAGLVLVLPYFGAETFALHVVARRSITADDHSLLALIDLIRYQPVAITTFGLGLVLLAASGVSFALAWQSSRLGAERWAAWPLGLLVALLLPQFYLPAGGRMVFGVAFLAAAALLALAAARAASSLDEVRLRERAAIAAS